MANDSNPARMISPSHSERRLFSVRADPGTHVQRVVLEWSDVGKSYVKRRMKEPGIRDDMIGVRDTYRGIPTRASVSEEKLNGHIISGITINSGRLNVVLLKDRKGGHFLPKASL